MKEIVKNNRLIAEFRGYELEETLKKEWVYAIERYNPDTDAMQTDFYTPEELKYHNSWDWLIPVIEEISQIVLPSHLPNYWNLDNISDIRIFRENKETTYKECLKFIIWYNQQTK